MSSSGANGRRGNVFTKGLSDVPAGDGIRDDEDSTGNNIAGGGETLSDNCGPAGEPHRIDAAQASGGPVGGGNPMSMNAQCEYFDLMTPLDGRSVVTVDVDGNTNH